MAVTLLYVLLACLRPAQAQLSSSLYDALEAMRRGNATEQQQALLFMNNDVINRARLNGWISDVHYQSAQADFAARNQDFAKLAAHEAGADFTVQKRTSQVYSPGTDSDYITRVKSPEQIKRMQEGYNARINNWLYDNGYAHTRKSDWHNRLDTDFMADPRHVTRAQFEEIATLNNDAYKRQAAAEFERVSRAKDGTKVTPKQFREYAEEMQDFIRKKQKKMVQLKANPALLSDPDFKAKYHQMMAQEQKYLSRIESATTTLRQQEGLTKLVAGKGELFDIVRGADGNWVMRNLGTIAERGAVRSPGNYGTTLVGSSIAQNSLERSIRNMSESLAEAAAKNPAFRATAADDIARLMASLPPSQKGELIDALQQRYGPTMANDVAAAMRKQSSRSAFKSLKAGTLKALAVIGVAADLYFAAQNLKDFLENMDSAMQPGLTDAEAEAYFNRAQEAANGLILAGGLGALMEAFPPVAMALGSWTIAYEGSGVLLRNTKTGEYINRVTLSLMDDSMQKYESLGCDLRDFFGYESICAKLKAVDRRLLASVLRALREGRVRLVDGAEMKDIADLIRNERYLDINKLLVKTFITKAQVTLACRNISEYNQLLQQIDMAVNRDSGAIADLIGKAGDAPDSFVPLQSAFADIQRVAVKVSQGTAAIQGLAGGLAVWAAHQQQSALINQTAAGTNGPASNGMCSGFDPVSVANSANQSITNMKASLLAIIFVYESRLGNINMSLLEEDELILKHLNNIRVAKGKIAFIEPLISERQSRNDSTSREQLAKLLVEKDRLQGLRTESEAALKKIEEYRKYDQDERDLLDERNGSMQNLQAQFEGMFPIALPGASSG